MRGGRREGAGRKKKPDHLKRKLVTIRQAVTKLNFRKKFSVGLFVNNLLLPK
jgi:hypothetical protein